MTDKTFAVTTVVTVNVEDYILDYSIDESELEGDLATYIQSILNQVNDSISAGSTKAEEMGRESRPFVVSADFDSALSDIRHGKERIKVRLVRSLGQAKSVSDPMSPTAAKQRVKGLDGAPVPGNFRLIRVD